MTAGFSLGGSQAGETISSCMPRVQRSPHRGLVHSESWRRHVTARTELATNGVSH